MWLIALYTAFISTILFALGVIYLMREAGPGAASGLYFLALPIVMLLEIFRARLVIAFGNTDNRAGVRIPIMAIAGGISFVLALAAPGFGLVRDVGFYICFSCGAIIGALSGAMTIHADKKRREKIKTQQHISVRT